MSTDSDDQVSTPAPKKPFRLGARPFHSDDDLLQSLRRRQQDMKSARQAVSMKEAAGIELNEDELQYAAPSRPPLHRPRSKFELKTKTKIQSVNFTLKH